MTDASVGRRVCSMFTAVADVGAEATFLVTREMALKGLEGVDVILTTYKSSLQLAL